MFKFWVKSDKSLRDFSEHEEMESFSSWTLVVWVEIVSEVSFLSSQSYIAFKLSQLNVALLNLK